VDSQLNASIFQEIAMNPDLMLIALLCIVGSLFVAWDLWDRW